jgi:hypothetical protein
VKSSRGMIALLVGAALVFGVLGYLSWRAKYGPARTISAAAAIDTIVIHQRVVGGGIRGPTAEDRLVSIDGRTGEEYTRTTVLRGQLVGTYNEKVIYSIGARLVFYDARTLEASPAPKGTVVEAPTVYGSMIDLGEALLFLHATLGTGRARASRLTKTDRSYEWSTELTWNGHDTKLVSQIGANIVIVDADGSAALDRNHGSLAWTR